MQKYKIIFIFLTLLNLSAGAYAVEETHSLSFNKNKMSLIPEIGNTSFHVIGMDSSYLSGNSLGANLRFSSDESKLSWSAGIRYFQAGLKKVARLGIFEMDLAQVELDYLAFPLKAEYALNNPTASSISYYIDGGVTPAYLLSAREKALIGSDTSEHGIRADLNGLDVLLGLSFGGRYFSDIGIIGAALEYQHGLIDLDSNFSSKNEGFVAKIGYSINI
jgi:hypothetical protein